MKIEYKNKGKYIEWTLDGDELLLDNTLLLSLSSFRGGSDVTLDVFADENGCPTLSFTDWYLAQIIIPAQTYTIRETGEADAMGFRQIEKLADALDTDTVTLILWAKEE